MTEDIHLLLGGYVLGGLSAEDRRAFDEHLGGCPRCRAELTEAAPIPALLRKVSAVPGTAPAILRSASFEPSLNTLLTSARSRRKRQSTVRWLATAAAVVIAFGGGATVVAMTEPNNPDANAQTMAITPAAGSNTVGRVGLTRKDWGTAIWLDLADGPHHGVYTLWAKDDAGHNELAATWGATASGHCSVDGATSITTDHLRQVSIVGPDKAVVASVTV